MRAKLILHTLAVASLAFLCSLPIAAKQASPAGVIACELSSQLLELLEERADNRVTACVAHTLRMVAAKGDPELLARSLRAGLMGMEIAITATRTSYAQLDAVLLSLPGTPLSETEQTYLLRTYGTSDPAVIQAVADWYLAQVQGQSLADLTAAMESALGRCGSPSN